VDGRNHVTRTRHGTVTKRHVGPGGAARAATAAAALRHADDHGLPVPQVRSVDGATLTMKDVGGATGDPAGVASGAALVGRSPVEVLRAIGSFARRLHDVPPPPGLRSGPGASGPASSAAWVHGDLCPVNVLVDHGNLRLVAVVDWEDSHVGDPLVDLVWTEWLVRAWHVAAVPHLAALYEAYGGAVPPVEARRDAMAACLAHQEARTTDPTTRTAWQRRRTGLADLDLSL
jgi:aminoglycoside phosphotransferase